MATPHSVTPMPTRGMLARIQKKLKTLCLQWSLPACPNCEQVVSAGQLYAIEELGAGPGVTCTKCGYGYEVSTDTRRRPPIDTVRL